MQKKTFSFSFFINKDFCFCQSPNLHPFSLLYPNQSSMHPNFLFFSFVLLKKNLRNKLKIKTVRKRDNRFRDRAFDAHGSKWCAKFSKKNSLNIIRGGLKIELENLRMCQKYLKKLDQKWRSDLKRFLSQQNCLRINRLRLYAIFNKCFLARFTRKNLIHGMKSSIIGGMCPMTM